MKEVNRVNSVTELEARQAADRLAKSLSGDMREYDVVEISRWCSSSEQRCDEFQALAELYDDCGELSDDADIQTALAEARLAPKRSVKATWAVSVAASLLIAVTVLMTGWMQGGSESVASERHVTRLGERKVVELADGSVINLNTSSELLVVMTENNRQVTMVRGEAYFDVAKDPQRPFSVVLNDRTVTVLGTSFNILKSAKGFTLAVVEGAVSLHRSAEQPVGDSPVLSADGEPETVASPHQRVVKKGTVAVFDTERRELSAYRSDNIERFGDWMDGILLFDNEPLYAVVRELNRYSAKKILIEDASIMDLKLYATLNPDRMSSALSVLEQMLPIRIIHYFDRVVIESDQ